MKRVVFDEYVVGTLMPDLVGHDRTPSAFLVYLALWARSRGPRGTTAEASHAMLAEDTGLSRSAVQSAIRRLVRRRLIVAEAATATSTRRYRVLRPWKRPGR